MKEKIKKLLGSNYNKVKKFIYLKLYIYVSKLAAYIHEHAVKFRAKWRSIK